MASKRGLYRPAPQENVGQKKNRKPLAQGRLVTNSGAAPLHQKGRLQSGVNVDDGKATTSSTVKPHSPYSSHLSSRPVQQGIIQGQRTPNRLVQGTSHNRKQEGVLTPRQIAPQITEHHSPLNNRSVNSLDLSDSELDISQQYKSPGTRVRKQKPSEVLLIDASRQTIDPNQSEVDIAVGFEKIPVTVVCHKSDALESSLRHTENVDDGRHVHADRVTAVSFSEPISSVEPAKHYKHSYVVKEKFNSGDNKDIYDENVPILTQIERDMQRQAARQSSYPQPNFNDSQGSEISDIPVRDQPSSKLDEDTTDSHSVMSESDACSLHEYVSSAAVKKSQQSTSKKTPAKTPNTAKKKKTRTVASRHMQWANTKTKTSLSVLMDKSVKEKNPKASRSLNLQQPAAASTKPKTSSMRQKNSTEGASTPENSRISTSQKTSTPTMDESFIPQDIDASAIHSEASFLSSGDMSKTQQTQSRNFKYPSTAKQHDVSHDPFSQSVLSNASLSHEPVTKKQKPKTTQHDLDLLYARYVQSLFLHSRQKKMREEQERQAMAQLFGLHEEVEKLRHEKFEMDQALARTKHLNQVDEQIDLQRQSLGPVVSNLPKLKEKYENLAHALDTTRHQIQTKGVYLPDDEDQYQRQLENALLESEQLLGEISVMIRSATPGVTSMADALQTMDKTIDSECQELKRCKEMLAAFESLAIHETSLEINAMQAVG